MKIAFVHYHLKTGGVTTVLRQQVTALRRHCDCLVLTGDRAGTELPCRIVEIPGLGYNRPGVSPSTTDRITDRMLDALRQQWPGGCDILHIHNPLIAKNRRFLDVINRLQQAGINLFLQIHDFAEDGRPDVYYLQEYPADCHYGVINLRDKKILRHAGLKEVGLHHLPNAVEPLPMQSQKSHDPLVLYPVRAIRRKNIGEAIILSFFLKGGRRLAITQPPNSPADLTSYRDWGHWIDANRLPVDLAAGRHTPFPQLVNAADSMITTSIAEGFGFSFLEPWTAGKWLWGRRLDAICADFEVNGIRLDGLYQRFKVPLTWIDRERYAYCWRRAVRETAHRYGYSVASETIDQAVARRFQSDWIDFGLLDERRQRQVGNRLIRDPAARQTLVEINPWLNDPGEPWPAGGLIESNRQAIRERYGQEQYRDRVLAIYDRVIGQRVCHRIDKRAVIEAFVDLDHFSLLQWGGYES